MIVLQDANTFFKDNGLYIALGAAALIFVVVGILLLTWPRKSIKSNDELFTPLIDALGGIDNIIKSEAKVSRLVVELANQELMDEEKLKKNAVEKIIKTSKKITLLVGDISVEIQEVIKKQKGTI